MRWNDDLRTLCGALTLAVGIALCIGTAAAGNPLPFHPITLPEDSKASSVVADTHGNFYVGGNTSNTYGVWAGKFDSEGRNLWNARIGTSYFVDVDDMSVDADGNVYLGGWIDGIFEGDSAGGGSGWLAKFNAAGPVWHTYIGPGADYVTIAHGIATDAMGNVFVAGQAFSKVGGSHKGGADSWIIKFDPDGQLLWKHQPGTTVDDFARAIATDPDGNVYLAGGTDGGLGGVKKGGRDAWLIKFDADGHWLWNRQPGTSADDQATAVATDDKGNVYVVGETSGAFVGTNKGGIDAWVAKFDAGGHWLWRRQNGTSRDDVVADAATDTHGNIYFVGARRGFVFPIPQDPSIIEYDRDGHWVWKDQPGLYGANSVAVDPTGNVYVVARGEVGVYLADDVP